MTDALKEIKKSYNIDNVVAVIDSATTDKDNRDYMQESGIDYLPGD